MHEVAHEIGIFNHISLFCADVFTKKFIECFRHLSLISNYLVIVFENNMVILLLARMDKRSNSAPKLPLISEFFFAEFLRMLSSYTALLLMLTTLFLMIIVFIPLIEFYKSVLVRM